MPFLQQDLGFDGFGNIVVHSISFFEMARPMHVPFKTRG
jgi:hypothetical protein